MPHTTGGFASLRWNCCFEASRIGWPEHTLALMKLIPILAILLCAAVARAEGYLIYVTNERSGDLTVIDGETRKPVGTIPVGKRPRGIIASHDGKYLYVALSGSAISGPPTK